MKKQWFALIAVLVLTVSMVSVPVLADGNYYGNWYAGTDFDNPAYPLYQVMSTEPNGYCYLYSLASDEKGDNMGRYNNGEKMRVLQYDVENRYTLVVTANHKIGYVHTYAIQPLAETSIAMYVYSQDPYGYAYLYSKASDRDGESQNLGRFDNLTKVEVVKDDPSSDWIYVKIDGTEQYGYMHRHVLFTPDRYPSEYEFASVWHSRGYVYLYAKASDNSNNMGRYDNGTPIVVLNWKGGSGFAFVKTMDGKTGYIKSDCLYH